jgi:hypothetical protein
MSKLTKRLIKIVACILLFIIFTGLALPTIASQTPVKNFILSKINNNISGKVQVENVNLGWMSGLDIQNMAILDPNGRKVAACKRVQFSDSLFSLLKSPISLGDLKILAPELTLIEEKDGSYSLENAFESKEKPEAKKSANTTETKPESVSAKKNESSTSTPSSPPAILGTVSLEDGAVTVTKQDKSSITISDLTCKISIQGLKEVSVLAHGEIASGNQKGNLDLNLKAQNFEQALTIYTQKLNQKENVQNAQNCEVNLSCNVTNFPIESIEPFMSMADPKLKGLLTSALGKTLDFNLTHTLKDGNFDLACNVKSPQLKTNIQLQTSQNELQITKPVQFQYQLTPEFVAIVSAILENANPITLKNQTTLQLSLDPTSIALPLTHEAKHTPLSGSITFSQPLLLNKKEWKQDVSVQLSANINSESIYDKISATLNGILSSGANTATLNSTASLQNIFAKDSSPENAPKGSITAQVQGNLPPLLGMLTGQDSLPQQIMGQTLSVQVTGVAQNIFSPNLQATAQSKIQSDALQYEANFGFKENILEVANSTLKLQLTPDKIALLAKTFQIDSIPKCSMLRVKIDLPQATIPLDLPAKINESTLVADVSFEPLDLSGLAGIDKMKVQKLQVSLAKEKNKDLFVKSDALYDLQSSTNSVQSLLGKTIQSTSSAKVTLDAKKIAVVDLKTDVVSDTVQLHIPKANLELFPKTILQVIEPVELICKIQQAALASIASVGTDALMVRENFALQVQVDPIAALNLDDLTQNASLKGKCSINEITLGNLTQPIGKYSLDLPFELNTKTSEVKASCNLNAKNKDDLTNLTAKFLLGYGLAAKPDSLFPALSLKSEGKFTSIPVKPFAQIAKKEELADLLGNLLSGSWEIDYKGPDSKTNPVKFQIAADDLSCEIALNIGDEIQAISNKNPLSVHVGLSPQRFSQVLKTFKIANTQNLQLKNDCAIDLTASKLKLPLALFAQNNAQQKTLGKLLDALELETILDIGKVSLQSLQNNKAFVILPLHGKASLLRGSKNITFGLKSTGSDTETPTRISITGSAKNLWDDKSIQLDQASIEIDAQLQELPTDLLNSFSATKDVGEKVTALVGSSLNAQANCSIVKMHSGVLQAQLKSENFEAEVASSIRDGKLYLNKPITAHCKLTGDAGKILFKDVNPLLASGVKTDNPIQITIDDKDFVIPLKPFSLQQVRVKKATIELGKIKVKKGGALDVIVALVKLKSIGSDSMKLWFTPLHFEILNGLVICKRADAQIDGSIHIATWGTINLIADRIDMVIGITGDSLIGPLNLVHLGKNYMLQVPLRGTTSNPEVDSKRATAKIAALKMVETDNPTAALLGGLLGVAASVGEEDAPVPPPTTQPFPWEKVADKTAYN